MDWVKVRKVEENYDSRVPIDFKKMGFDHVRIRVKEDIKNPEFREKLKRAVEDALDAGLFPILAYKAEEFKLQADEKTEKGALD